MKSILTVVFLGLVLTLTAQSNPILQENFYQKMVDFKEFPTNFDIPTTLEGFEARFVAFQCRYFSDASSRTSGCSRGFIVIEKPKATDFSYLEFPQLASCRKLEISLFVFDKGSKNSIALQKMANDNTWQTLEEYVFDKNSSSCVKWLPKSAESSETTKFRLAVFQKGSIAVTDIYIEGM